MKYTRLLIGVVLILGALWVLVGEQMSRASANAFVNAPVVTLRADVAGTLVLSDGPPGSRIKKGEILGTITDPLVDTIRLNDLLMERGLEQAALDRIGAHRDGQRAIRERLDQRSLAYREDRLATLRIRLDHARIRLRLLEEGATDEAARRLGDVLDATGDRLPSEPQFESLAIDYAQERVSVLEIRLGAAEAGIYLGESSNDAPVAEQRVAELDSILAALDAEYAETAARIAAVEERITREQVRVNALRGGDLRSPVEGLLWEVLEGDGVTVQRGDPLLRLVDCRAVFVTLSVAEGVYNGLRLGAPATFRFEGDGTTYDATIARLAGSGAARVYEHLAVAPSERHLERFDVALLVPGLAEDPDQQCPIGRTGRVFFDSRPLDGLRGLFGG